MSYRTRPTWIENAQFVLRQFPLPEQPTIATNDEICTRIILTPEQFEQAKILFTGPTLVQPQRQGKLKSTQIVVKYLLPTLPDNSLNLYFANWDETSIDPEQLRVLYKRVNYSASVYEYPEEKRMRELDLARLGPTVSDAEQVNRILSPGAPAIIGVREEISNNARDIAIVREAYNRVGCQTYPLHDMVETYANGTETHYILAVKPQPIS